MQEKKPTQLFDRDRMNPHHSLLRAGFLHVLPLELAPEFSEELSPMYLPVPGPGFLVCSFCLSPAARCAVVSLNVRIAECGAANWQSLFKLLVISLSV